MHQETKRVLLIIIILFLQSIKMMQECLKYKQLYYPVNYFLAVFALLDLEALRLALLGFVVFLTAAVSLAFPGLLKLLLLFLGDFFAPAGFLAVFIFALFAFGFLGVVAAFEPILNDPDAPVPLV